MKRRARTMKEMEQERLWEQMLLEELKNLDDVTRQRLHSEIRDNNKKIFEMLHPPKSLRKKHGVIYAMFEKLLFDGLQQEIEQKFNTIFMLANSDPYIH